MIAPIYQDISRCLEQYIKDHALTGKLPGTRQLSRELGCHHVTLSKAIHLLEQRGLVEELSMASADVNGIVCQQDFERGYQLGALLMLAAFTGPLELG